MTILQSMADTRELVSLFNNLKQEHKILLSTEFLDYAYGGYTDQGNTRKYGSPVIYLDADHRKVLAQAIEIHKQHGFDLSDRMRYQADNDFTPPQGKDWITLHKDNKWVSLYTLVPDWLQEYQDKKKQHRALMQERKDKGLTQDMHTSADQDTHSVL